jgi:hypothetical protein
VNSHRKNYQQHNLQDILTSDRFKQTIDCPSTLPFMNVGSNLDPTMQSVAARDCQKKYGARACSLMTGPHCAQPIIDRHVSPRFLAYQQSLRGYTINPIMVDFDDLEGGFPLHQIGDTGGKTLRAMLVTPELLQESQRLGLQVADWNKNNIKLALQFHDKAQLSNVLTHSDLAHTLKKYLCMASNEQIVPKAIEIKAPQLISTVLEKLYQYTDLYQHLDATMQNIYGQCRIQYQPHHPGVIIRPCWGGGNYDMFSVHVTGQYPYAYTLHIAGQIFNDITEKDLATCLQREVLDKSSLDTFLLTRFLDVRESPGINLILRDDWYYSTPGHNQLFEQKRAVGTTTCIQHNTQEPYYQGYLRSRDRNLLLTTTQEVATQIARYLSANGGRGFSGIDFMLTGFFEYAFAQAVRNTADADEAVGPITIAEMNVRPTQSLLQAYNMMAIQRNVEGQAAEPLTYSDLLLFYTQLGTAIHYVARDAVPLGECGLTRLYDTPSLLAGINQKAEGIYIIMVDADTETRQTGIGIMADSQENLQWYEQRLQEILTQTQTQTQN